MTRIYEVVVKKPKINSGFGMRKHPITGKMKMHNGIDLVSKASPKDLNIYAIDDGVVQKVVTNKSKATTGYGNYIWVRYPRYNLSLFHAHCSKINYKKGDKVKAKDVLAIMGRTGAATGVHCHLGMTNIGSDKWLDPINFEMLPKETFKVGDKVIPIRLVNYNGKHLIQYDKYYYINELSGDRAVLVAKRGNRYYTWAAMNTKDIELYKGE